MIVALLVACSFFIIAFPSSGADTIPPNSEVTVLDQDFTASPSIPQNMVLGNNLGSTVSTTLNYNSAAQAIEYKMVDSQVGSVFVGIDPFINGNLTISLKVNSDDWNSNVYISGSTFWLQAQTLYDGRARVQSLFYTAPRVLDYRYYDVPASELTNGINDIHIMVSGTTRSVTIYHDSVHKMTTPMRDYSVQQLPYDPTTEPIIVLSNEISGAGTWVSTLLYGIKETMNGGLVSAIPGNDYVPFGLDAPTSGGNSMGTQYMASHGQTGVAWADVGWLAADPQSKDFINSLLAAGWELGIHFSARLNDLPLDQALALMQDQYNQIKSTFGRPPLTWSSLQGADNVTHANYAYNTLGMLWRSVGMAYIANAGNLMELYWPSLWSRISGAQMVFPSFTHSTDGLNPQVYSISYPTFSTWVDNYNSKHIVGFNEYYNRISNQVDTKIHYLNYVSGQKLKFSIECNGYPSRLVINFPASNGMVVLKNGSPLVRGSGYTVDANNNIVLFGSSNDVFEITAPAAPGAPQNLQATAGDGQAALSWEAPSGTGAGTLTYHLFRDSVQVWSGTVLTHTDIGLTNGQTYTYTVSANNTAGWGPNSTAVQVTPASTPLAPTGLTATPGKGVIGLTWSAPSSNGGSAIAGYKVYRGTSSGSETLLATLGNVLAYSDTSVSSGVTYYYTVTAVNGAGESPWSNEISATPFSLTTAPTIISAVPGNAQAILTWSAPSSDGGSAITGYNIYRGTASGSETLMTSVGNVLTYTDTSVTNGVTYYYKVTAINGVGEGPQSNEASATPATTPSAPQSPTAIAGNAQVTLTWSAPSSDGGSAIAGYKVYRGTSSGSETLLATLGDVLTYTDTSAANGVTYYYVVSAINGAGEGPKSAEVSTTPAVPATVPTAPQSPSGTAGNAQVILTWAAPSSDGGSAVTNYKIYRGTASGTETLLTTVGNVLTYTDTSVTNGVKYYYAVTAVNGVGESPQSSEVSATPSTVPAAPTLASATAGDAQVVLTWSAPVDNGGSAITGYNIYRGTASGTETLLTSVGNVLTYTDTTVTNGQTYYYTVSAVNARGEGGRSNELSAVPASAASTPSAPQNPQAISGDAQVVLTWTAPSNDGGSAITGYKVYRGTTSGGETLLATLGNVLTYADTSVTNGVTYYYKVSAVNSVGEGPVSVETSTTPAGAPGAPSITSSVPGDTQVTLTWTAPTDNGGSAITGYKVYRGTTSESETLLTTLGNVLTYTDTSVTNGVTYYYMVSAVNSVGEGAKSIEASATPAAVSTAPTLSSAVPGNAQMVLSWSAPTSNGGSVITGYKVYRGTTSGSETLLTTLGNVLTYTDSSVTNGVTYYYKVSAVNGVGEGPQSNEVSGVPATISSTPQNLGASGGNAQVILTWSAPSSDGGSAITGYKVYRGTASGGETLLTTLGDVHTYTDSSVTNGQTYYYVVTAVNGAGESSRSGEASATPTVPATAPTAPQSLSGTAGNAQVTLTWSAPSSDGGSAITNYKVYRGTISGGETLLVTLGNVLTYTDTSVTNGVKYYYTVTAINGIGESLQSNEISATPSVPATAPSAPQGLTANAGNAQVVLTWSAPSSDGGSAITGYNVYRGTASGGETLLTTRGNVLTYTDDAVTNGVNYYYKVSAVNSAGEGPLSAEVSTSPAAAPSAPTITSASPGNAQVVLAWSAPSSDGGSAITGYNIYRGTSSGGETLLATLGSVLTYTDTSVTNGVTYYYKVTAINGVGEGSQSNEASAIPATVPSAPQGLTSTPGNARVTLTWSAPADNGGSAVTGYKIYRGTISGGETLLATLGNVLTYADTSVTNGVTYYYKVSAVNAFGEGPQSSEVSALPADRTIVVTSPSSDVTWYRNTAYTITWTASGSGNVRLELVQGSTVIYTIASSTTNDGTQSWKVPISLPLGSGYQVRVSSVANLNTFALSPGKITVADPVVTVTAPSASSVLVAGGKVTVTWTSLGTIPGLKVELLKGGTSVLTLTSSTANDGTQTFTLPFSLVPGSDYSIRMTDTSNPAVTDTSDLFTIRAPALAITYPNGGETLVAGSSVQIQWTGDMSLLGRVNITLWQNGKLMSTLTTGTSNSGSFTWSSSATLAAGTGYVIRITPSNHPEFYDESDASFSIRKPVLTVTSPVGGNSYTRSTTMTISWQKETANIGSIRIELYQNGVLVRTIATGASNSGTYNWRIPSTLAAGSYQIKISSTIDPSINAWSGVFNIR